MFERYTERARRALFFARYAVSEHGGLSIEPEHLLLGLLRAGLGGVIGQLFLGAQASADEIQAELDRLVPNAGPVVGPSVEIPFAATTRQILYSAANEADRLKSSSIDSEHLLLAILLSENTLAASVLTRHGFDLESVRKEIARSRGDASPDPQSQG